MPGNATLQQAAEALATPKPSAQKGPSQRIKQVLLQSPDSSMQDKGRYQGYRGKGRMSRCHASWLMLPWIAVELVGMQLQGGGGQHAELSGYHAKRHEFEPEYDQDAELMVSELEFRESDTQVRCPPQYSLAQPPALH